MPLDQSPASAEKEKAKRAASASAASSQATDALKNRISQLQVSTTEQQAENQQQFAAINAAQVMTTEQLSKAQAENQQQFASINATLQTIMASIVGAPSTATAGGSQPAPAAFAGEQSGTEDRRGSNASETQSEFSTVRQQHAHKLHDLPSFSGAPEDWNDFVANFTQSTQAFNYTHLDNNIRLRKCLVGCAKDAVRSLLQDANDTDKVMASLERRFGRPDLLVQAHLRQLRWIAPIPESRQELIVLFASKVANTLNSLDKAKTKRFLMNPDLLEELVMKLPQSRRSEWGNHAAVLDDYPSMHDFSKWLDRVAVAVSFMTPASLLAATTEMPMISKSRVVGQQQQQQQTHKPRERLLHAAHGGDCGVCGATGHTSTACAQFKRANINDRWEMVRARKLCFSCLQFGHNSTTCPARKQCGIGQCLRSHHSMLHSNPFGQQSAEGGANRAVSMHAWAEEPTQQEDEVEPTQQHDVAETTERSFLGQAPSSDATLFRVLPVQITGPAGTINTFALYDEGSSISIVEKSLADDLGLVGPENRLDLQWLGSRFASEMSRTVSLQIKGVCENARQFTLAGVRTMRNLDLPKQNVDMAAIAERHPHMRGLPIASYTEAVPQILLGVDNAFLGVALRHVCEQSAGPLAAKTRLGWTICGAWRAHDKIAANACGRTLHAAPVWLDELHDAVKQHFSLEGVGVYRSNAALESRQDKRARSIMEATTRLVGNRYETGLLWRQDVVSLPDSKTMATNRLQSLERKMSRDPAYAARYKTVIAGLVESGYARRLTPEEVANVNQRTWYLPHFAALNPNKPEKLRVVFDAAACVNGVSLNSALAKGPDNNRALVDVLHNFRIGAVGVCADIKEMFLRVRIRREDVNAQRFLWREKTDQPIDVYIMDSMIFGAACSPSSAQFVKNKNADDNGGGQAEAIRIIKEAHYVDDLVASFHTAGDAIRTARAVVDIHRRGGFELRGFVSNRSEVVREITGNNEGETTLDMQLDSNATDKILGMHWCTSEDAFRFRLAFNRVDAAVIDGSRIATKREILSAVMSIYDPFGILANFTVYGKLILQDIWRHGSLWDECVHDEIHKQWCQWIAKLEVCRAVRVPRWYGDGVAVRPVQLHIFADSSQSAMAAVAYWRLDDGNGGWRLSFIIGKSRVAPPKMVSMPRLELQAAILAVRLNRHIRATHRLNIESTTYWTDSKTVVLWIRSSRSHFPPFVAHRLAEIWEESVVTEWRWVPTNLNPADDATRAHYPVRFAAVNRWISGPDFLRLPEDQWPMEDPATMLSQDGAERGQPCSVQMVCPAQILPVVQFTRFGNYFRLTRSMAYVLRFVKNLRSTDKERGALMPCEIENAERHLVRAAQQEAFAEELATLRRGDRVGKGSAIRELLPFLDKNGVMRVNGRIDRAECLPEDAKQPMILPKVHTLTDLIVACYHRRLRHQQQGAVIGEIRTKFWVPHLRVIVKRIKSACLICRHKAAQPIEPVLGQLPIDRLTPYVRPFTYCGVDYFGPLHVTVGRRREKRYVALFTCMTVRACHLELAADLSTDAFILCLRNFINLRGTPLVIRSDNGTNFVGASRELREAIDFLDHAAIQNELSVNRIEWKFNCPSHPQAGGCWERLVQCVKRVLSATVKEVAPRVETIRSLLIEAANIVNSRPLTHLPVNSDEDEPLTPNHFIMGCSNSTQTPGPDDNHLMCLRKQWRIATALKNRFWKQWLQQYLPDLTRRTKGYDEHPELKMGDLVLVVDALLPRGQWKRGRVTAVYPGIDGRVRCAQVKTSESEFRRPVSKLAVLRVEGES